MSRKVRVGLVGCGKIAQTHAQALASLEEADFVACCDADEARARALAAQHGVPQVFADVGALFRSGAVEAVCVCTPHPSHGAIVVAAAEAGVHVLCEKPLTVDLGEANRMVEAAEKAGIKFGGIFQRRFWPAAQRIRRAIDDGKLGTVTLAECAVRIWRPESYFAQDAWRGKWATEGGGVLMNQAVHAIDLLQWYLGPVKEVFGRYNTFMHGAYIDVEDTAVATLVGTNGALATIQAATTYNPTFGFRVAVHGTSRATASVWEMPEGREGVNDVWNIPGEEGTQYVWQEGVEPPAGFPGFHILQIQDFLQAVRDDRAPAVTGAEAKKALEIILAIYESSRVGRVVQLPMAG
jgi:UDP-N-acetyl-2-amino-2-deoxyglucuronate dehydrogenase